MEHRIENQDGQLVYRVGQAGTGEIYDIAVNTERMKGHGRALVEEALKQFNPKTLYAFTRRSNTGARTFYKKLGFREILIEGFYDGEDAVMVLYENPLYR